MARKPQKMFWYKRYPSKFIGGTTMLADYEKGVYSTLIDLMYDKGGPIEDSPVDLARICGCANPKRFQAIRDRLVKLGKITIRDGFLSNPMVDEELGRTKNPEGVEDRPDALAEKEGSDLFGINGLDPPKSQSQKLEVKKQEGRVARAGERVLIPDGWKPSEENLAYAAGHGFDRQAVTRFGGLAEAFVDHHTGRANRMAGPKGWDGAWRTWVRNEIKFNAGRKPQGGGSGRGGKTTFGDMAREGMGRLTGEDNGRKH